MTEQRWKELMNSTSGELTEQEFAEGWHFCWDWDGLLVGPGMGELVHCNCVSLPEPTPET